MSWNLGELNLTKLRKVLTIYDSGTGALVDTCVPAANELLTSHTGTALANAAGSLVRIGQGGFYYQGVAADAATEGFTAIVVNKAGFLVAIAYSLVVGGSGKIWIPLTITNNGDLATGCNPNGVGELQMSINGGAWIAATGTFVEVGLGLYYYVHDAPNVQGFVGIKILKAGFDETIAWGSVDGAVPQPPAPAGIGSLATGIMAGIGFWNVTA
jgi:hypothetical protein